MFKTSDKIFSPSDAYELAKKRLPKIIFDYVEGAAGDEELSKLNRTVIKTEKLIPRILLDVEERSISKKVFDHKFDMPFGIAPMGMSNVIWPKTDKYFAEASKKFNLPFCLSTAASSSIEYIAERSGGNAWFQLYTSGSMDFINELIKRAENSNYNVLIFTVDVPILSPRYRDIKNGFGMPLKLGVAQLFDLMLHPQWTFSTLFNGIPKPMNYYTSKVQKYFDRNASRASGNWEFLKKLRNTWKGKLIIKGVMSVYDVKKLKKIGVDGIWISNHGGRQFNAAPTSFEAIKVIRKEIGKNMTIILDSGIRNGEDIIKSIAVGADFVMLGRQFLYAVGADGKNGLEKMILLLKEEVSTIMGLAGLTKIENVSEKILAKNHKYNL